MINRHQNAFQRGQRLSLPKQPQAESKPHRAAPSQLMLTELMAGWGAASKPGAWHNLSGSRRRPWERHRQPGWEAGLARPPEQAEASPGPPGLRPGWEAGLARPPEQAEASPGPPGLRAGWEAGLARPPEQAEASPGPPGLWAGSGQSQAKGQMLWGLFYLQTISKMAGMFCFSKEPPGKAFIAQAECRDRYPPPTARHPSPRRLQRFNESEAATPTSASLQKLSAFLGAETSPVTLPWLMQTRTQDRLSKMLQGLLLEAGFRCHFPEHLTINVCVLENDDMLFRKSPGSSIQPTLKGGAGTFCLECLAMGGASERLCTSRKTGDKLITPQAA